MQRRPLPPRGDVAFELARFDPVSLARSGSGLLRESSSERDVPPQLVASGERIWLALAGSAPELVAFDARRGRIEKHFRLARGALGDELEIAAEGERIWALVGGDLRRIDAGSGAVESLGSFSTFNGLALSGGSLWLRNVRGTELRRYDAASFAGRPSASFPPGHQLATRRFAHTWVAGGSDPAILLSSRPQNEWTGKPAPDVVAAFDLSTGSLVPVLRLTRAILEVAQSGATAALLALDFTPARIELALVVADWPGGVVRREVVLGTRRTPRFPSNDPDYRPVSVALGAGSAWVCLADYGIVRVPIAAEP